ncbi:MAG: GDYXXLXY domain-containing protein [Acidobacteriia bacterium]|nr:GDYXXLXY domain-containing protein [Terriglobia bacterium]
MSPLRKGLLLAAAQLLLVASLGGKFAWDRAHLPRVWVRTAAYDPELPIRGRYLSLRLRVQADRVYGNTHLPDGNQGRFWEQMKDVYLSVENGELVANPAPGPTGLRVTRWKIRDAEVASLQEPVAFFLPEHAADPSRRAAGEELWMEVTVPKKGPPRPIRLGVKRGEKITPLDIQ